MKTKRGFTLIELLVVIAIIGILLAVLIPALRIAKQQATSAVCLSHQKGLLLAYKLYVEDNDGELPVADVRPAQDYAWTHPPTLVDGTRVYGLGQNVTLEDRIRGFQNGVLYPYSENYKLYHCPGDNRWKVGTNRGTTLDYMMYRSYNVQGGLHGEEVTLNGSKSTYHVKKVTEITKNLPIVYVFVEEYYDGAGSCCNGGSWQLDARNNGHSWWNTMSVWHNWRSTLSFIDGHAEKMKWEDERTILFAQDRQHPDLQPDPYDQPNNPDLELITRGYAVPLPRP
ncbi:MAG: type II secretion system protein [Sedimentisphaerales bacterium]|nr:type II secretion system protein [Sedimentisphaerales bacterium]